MRVTLERDFFEYMNGIDLAKIPFFTFLFSYGTISACLIGLSFFISGKIEGSEPYCTGFALSLFLQMLSNTSKVFFMNEEWSSSPVTVQLFITISSFFVNAGVLYYFSMISKNIPAVIGFFIAYYLNLKIIVLVAHYFTRNQENA